MVTDMTPKVSIITPIYGVEKYIERCVDSLFAQTLNDIEFIFIDDCTLDKSMELLRTKIDKNRLAFVEKGWTVRTERMLSNSGLPAVRKHGIQLATGDYVIHCDSDDWVEPTMYEKMYNAAIEQQADVVVCDYYVSNGNCDKKIISATNPIKTSNYVFKDTLTQKIGASVWNKLVRRDLVPYNRMVYAEANMGEDYVLTIQYLYYAKKVAIVDEPLYYYYYNENSITKQMAAEKVYYRFVQSVCNMRPITKFMEQEGICDIFQKELDKLKFAKRNNLLPIISDAKYYRVWKSTFPEINSRILWNPYVRLNEKVKYLLTYLRIVR